MEAQNNIQRTTDLMLRNRKNLSLTGIEDVISFDELSVYLVTGDGNLLIEGTDLHIATLDVSDGNMTIDGYIRSIIYHDKTPTKKSGFLSKVFK